MKIIKILIIIVMFFIHTCNKQEINIMEEPIMTDAINFNTIVKKTIYFGHMSVGNNILAGVEEIINQEDFGVNLKLNHIKNSKQIDSIGFYHSNIGRNGDPFSKITAFKEFIINDSVGQKVDIAFFKFCYVDNKKDINVNDVINEYVNTINQIKKKYPKLKIIHFTCPLKTHSIKGRTILSKFKRLAKRLLLGDIDNVRRNEYNSLLREKYSAENSIFDLAKFESINEDGIESTFSYKGKKYSSMQTFISNDGGHLNKQGQILIAKKLLEFLTVFSSE